MDFATLVKRTESSLDEYALARFAPPSVTRLRLAVHLLETITLEDIREVTREDAERLRDVLRRIDDGEL